MSSHRIEWNSASTDSELDAFSNLEGLEQADVRIEEARSGTAALRRVRGRQDVKLFQERAWVQTRLGCACWLWIILGFQSISQLLSYSQINTYWLRFAKKVILVVCWANATIALSVRSPAEESFPPGGVAASVPAGRSSS